MGSEIAIRRVHGKRADARGELLDPFAGFELPWREPGMIYCFIDSDPRVAQTRRRDGWVVCNLQRDFLDKGCPPDLICQEWASPDGTIRFGQNVLAKMPAEKRSRMMRYRLEQRQRKRAAVKEAVLAEGERAAQPAIRAGVLPRGSNLVFEPTEER